MMLFYTHEAVDQDKSGGHSMFKVNMKINDMYLVSDMGLYNGWSHKRYVPTWTVLFENDRL